MNPSILPDDRSQLPHFYQDLARRGAPFIGMLNALRWQFHQMPDEKLIGVKTRFDLDEPLSIFSPRPEDPFLRNANELIDRFVTGNPAFASLRGRREK